MHIFLSFSIEQLPNTLKILFEGLKTSFLVFILTLLISIPLGMIIYFLRRSKIKVISLITQMFIAIMRGTPLMLQLFVVYYGPNLLLNITVSDKYRFYAVIIGFSVNYAAYFAEIYRAGFESISKGQYEASKMLGMNKRQTFFNVILPQVLSNTIPPITNEVITLIKDTSLAFSIGVVEMFTNTKQLAGATSSLAPYFIAMAIYFIFNYLVAYLMKLLEKKLNVYRKC